ncbi:T9SS type A sorting domain-containing protein [Dyadobacter fermentans]|uniref:Secretion system C-terminal sorting domain-containing protein n=1 Tax=Dyadobacter fermentans (strain ATCC 700827 / DSM 18053 / CIP 107007 / KCTC 52180 / NS114) TaxID=471854 RepID=C6VZU0_DYAFD|nr:T9SS type A sorting domain-containing protein [Dyadobacter fermentans]ACT93568.1 hypothetical protein Dfer_2349 [Dyadobacter fermentans DSM 18053]
MKTIFITLLLVFLGEAIWAQSFSLGIFGASASGSGENVSLDWSLGSVGATNEVYAALPVRLIYFKGVSTGANQAELTWMTASETSNAGFEIQKSVDGKYFEKAGWVDGKGDRGGVYSFSDNDLYTTSYYRLKQIDWDESSTFSRIVSIVPMHESIRMAAAYPNPAIDGKVNLKLPANTSQLTISDQNGTLISSHLRPNRQEIAILLRQSGIYLFRISTPTEATTLRVVRP